MTIFTLFVTVSMIATTELITLNLVTTVIEFFFYPDTCHGQRKMWGMNGNLLDVAYLLLSHIYNCLHNSNYILINGDSVSFDGNPTTLNQNLILGSIDTLFSSGIHVL